MAEETSASTSTETAASTGATGASGDTQGQQGSTTSTPEGFDWKSLIPEPLKGESVWNDIKDKDTLFKRFVDNHKYNVGALRLPPKGAHPTAWDEVYNKLGRPESPDKYEVVAPPMPEGVPWDDDTHKEWLGHFHKAGLNSQQAQELLNQYGDWIARQHDTMQQQSRTSSQEAEEALRAEFGTVTYDRKLNTVRAFIRAEGNPKLIEELERTGWANHPELTRLLMSVAEDWRSDQVAGGMKEEDFTGMPSPDTAKKELETMMADLKGPYWITSHPNHKQTRERAAMLAELAFPNERRPE